MISQMKDHSISVDQDEYATSIVDKYLYSATVKTGTKFYKTYFPSDMIFNNDDEFTSDKQVEKLTRDFNIHYIFSIVSFIYFLIYNNGFDFCSSQVRKVSSYNNKLHFEVLVDLLI